MEKLFKATRSGTARNGAERDRGHVIHLVQDNDYPSWEKAICGVQPKGNGWYYREEEINVTCDKCLKKAILIGQPIPWP